MSKTALFAAARQWQSKELAYILRHDPDLVHAADPRGRTALHHCAATRSDELGLLDHQAVETAKTLLKFGADINAVESIEDQGDIFLARPLWYAIAKGNNIPLAKYLVRRGANLSNCLWAVIWDNNPKLLKFLLERGAPLEEALHGETPLVYAARLGRLAMVKGLVKGGADKSSRDRKGRSPLDYARSRSHPEMIALLR